MIAGPSGSTLIVEENHDLPLARVTVTLRTGAADDPPGSEGLAAFAGELARRGAAGKSRAALDEAFEQLGGSLDLHVGQDALTFDLEVLARHLSPAVALLADVLLRPDFPEAEVGPLRRESHAALDELRDDDGSLAQRFFARQLFGAHPYGRPRYGTEASIDRLSAEAARRWMERALAGGNLLFGAAGDIDPTRIAELLARRFGTLREGAPPLAPLPDPEFPGGLRLQIIDKPERTQSQILLGHPAPRWSDPDFLPLNIATTAFGGTFTARLMTEVRAKRGLSYGASARLGQARGVRPIAVAVSPSLKQTPETLALVLSLWRDWIEGGLRDEEIAFARDYLAASFAFHIATPEDRLDFATSLAVAEMPVDYRETQVARIRAVTDEEVRGAMARRLRPSDLSITIVSTAKRLKTGLEKSGLSFESIAVVAFDSD